MYSMFFINNQNVKKFHLQHTAEKCFNWPRTIGKLQLKNNILLWGVWAAELKKRAHLVQLLQIISQSQSTTWLAVIYSSILWSYNMREACMKARLTLGRNSFLIMDCFSIHFGEEAVGFDCIHTITKTTPQDHWSFYYIPKMNFIPKKIINVALIIWSRIEFAHSSEHYLSQPSTECRGK